MTLKFYAASADAEPMDADLHMMMVVDDRLAGLWQRLHLFAPNSDVIDAGVRGWLLRSAYIMSYAAFHQHMRAVSDDDIDLQLISLWTVLIADSDPDYEDDITLLAAFLRDAWRQGDADAARERGTDRGSLYRQLGRQIAPEDIHEAA